MPRLGWVCILAVFLFSATSVRAGTYNASRIELKDGTRLSDASFTTDNFSEVIEIKSDGDSRAVSFNDIVQIVKNDGVDAARSAPGKYYSPSGEVSEPTTHNIGKDKIVLPNDWSGKTPPKRPEPWRLRLSAHANLSQPVGDFYDGVKGGFGYGADLSVRVSHSIAIRGTLSRAGLRSFDLTGGPFGKMEIVQDNSSFSAWRYSIAAEYHTWPGYGGDGHKLYFAYVGIGWIRHSVSGSLLLYNPTDSSFYIAEAGDPVSKFMVLWGGGMMLAISSQFGINFGSELYMIYRDSPENTHYSDYNEFGTVYNFDLKLGIVLIR